MTFGQILHFRVCPFDVSVFCLLHFCKAEALAVGATHLQIIASLKNYHIQSTDIAFKFIILLSL